MHQQITQNNLVCREFVEALEKCHENSLARYFGGCNNIKLDLNMCLRKERLERSARNREDAKVRAEKRKKALDLLHQDD